MLERKVTVVRIVGDLGVRETTQGAVLVGDNRPEALETRTAERRILREQEISAPEAFARDRAVRLPIDGKKYARRIVRLRDAFHKDQNMSVGIGINRSGAQRVLFQRYGVVVGLVIVRRRSSAAGVHGVCERRSQIITETGHEPRRS